MQFMGKAVTVSTLALCVHSSVILKSVEGRGGGTLALLASNPWGKLFSGTVSHLARC